MEPNTDVPPTQEKTDKNAIIFLHIIILIILSIPIFVIYYLFNEYVLLFIPDIFIFTVVYTFQMHKPPQNLFYSNRICLELLKEQRLGNQMITFIKGIQLAKYLGIKIVFIKPGFIMQTRPFFYEDIRFELVTSKLYRHHYAGKCNVNRLYYKIYDKLPLITFDLDSKFRSYFAQLLTPVNVSDDALVVHLRSGDIFHKAIHYLYGQPPCGFYREAIQMKNWSKVIIVSEDRRNPCVNILENETNSKFEQHELKYDLSILLNARNVALSRGTFGFAVLALSNKLKNIFMFNMSNSRIPDHMNCIPTKNYYDSVIKSWRNQSFQYKLMKESSCQSWEFIPRGNQSTDYIHKNVF